jgi:hypothetical protein
LQKRRECSITTACESCNDRRKREVVEDERFFVLSNADLQLYEWEKKERIIEVCTGK